MFSFSLLTTIIIAVSLAAVLCGYHYLTQIVTEHCSTITPYTFLTSAGVTSEPSPSILIVAGTHGNEPAGAVALNRLKDMFETGELVLQRGSLTLIPEMNKCGLNMGIRWQPAQLLRFTKPDLNRNYPKTPGEEAGCPISKTVTSLADSHDLVIDLHEGWGWALKNKHSMGSGVYSANLPISQHLADIMTEEVNTHAIPQGLPPFIHQRDYKDIPGTLRWHCNGTNKNYILIETSGQNNIQPIDTRANQHLTMIIKALDTLDMIKTQPPFQI